MIDWNSFRRADGTITLGAAYRAHMHWLNEPATVWGQAYLADVEAIKGIHSRQAAAIAIATAVMLGKDKE